MLQLIRSLETNVRKFVRSVRQSPRHRPRLPFTLSMLDHGADRISRNARRVNGYTRNISETGMALIVPAIRNGDNHLAARNRKLLIVLELPTGPIRLQAAPIRYERIKRNTGESGYLLGVRIVSMSDNHKHLFLKYLNRLYRGEQLSVRKRTING